MVVFFDCVTEFKENICQKFLYALKIVAPFGFEISSQLSSAECRFGTSTIQCLKITGHS